MEIRWDGVCERKGVTTFREVAASYRDCFSSYQFGELPFDRRNTIGLFRILAVRLGLVKFDGYEDETSCDGFPD